MHRDLHKSETILMVVDTLDSQILAEAPPMVEGIKPGLIAVVGQIRGVVTAAQRVDRDSAAYAFAQALAGEPRQVTEIYEPRYIAEA